MALVAYRFLAGGLNLDNLFRGVGITAIKAIGLFTVVSFAALIIARKIQPYLGDRAQRTLLYTFVLVSLLSSFVAIEIRNVGTYLLQSFQNILLYFIFINLYAESKWLNRFAWVITAALLATCLSGILSAAVENVARAAGTMRNPNGLAMVANLTAAAFLVLLLASRDLRRRAVYVLGLVVAVATTFVTGSRGGLVALVVTFTYQLTKGRRALAPYLVGIAVFAAVFSFIPEQYKMRQVSWFSTLLGGNAEEATGGSRGFIYRSAWDIFKRSPIIGVGPRTFGTIYQAEYSFKSRGPAAHARSVHSGFLEVLVQMGVVGFAVFVALIVVTLVLYRKNDNLCRRKGLGSYRLLNSLFEALFIAVLASGAFETIIRLNSFFILLAAAAAINRAAALLPARPPVAAEDAALPVPEAAA